MASYQIEIMSRAVEANKAHTQRKVENTLDGLLERVSRHYEVALGFYMDTASEVNRANNCGRAAAYREVMDMLKGLGAMNKDLRAVERSKQQLLEAAE